MVEQQQKSVRSVGGNSPVRSAKIFKFRRFRCKKAHDSLQTYSESEDDTYSVFGVSKRSFLVYGDAMQWSSSWLRGCVKSSRNARCLIKLYPSNNELHLWQLFSSLHGFILTVKEKKVNKTKCANTLDMFGHISVVSL